MSYILKALERAERERRQRVETCADAADADARLGHRPAGQQPEKPRPSGAAIALLFSAAAVAIAWLALRDDPQSTAPALQATAPSSPGTTAPRRTPEPTATSTRPSQPEPEIVPPPPEWRGRMLQAHVYDPDPAARMIIIDGRMLREGDAIDDARVRAITPDGAWLESVGRTFHLHRFGR
ncbi:MAG: general secretion pathway protein GspB [Mariprofundaceae bacterium]